ncbi:MAG TPA: hypothetical protein VN375_01720 [Vicinamibacteria bacterium]|nr:hypothetical protein [Vicinamibacteria bacterium]
MTHLAVNLAAFLMDDFEMRNFGLWLFLSVGAVSLFAVFIPLVSWIEGRRKEREAYYKAETFRRLAEASGEGAKAALELMREEDRLKRLKTMEGIKLGGVINLAVGIGLSVMLRTLIGTGGPYLVGLIPGLVGVALLVYAFFMAEPVR